MRFREIENNNHPHPSNESSWILFIPLLPIHPTIYAHIYIHIKNYNYASDHRQKDGFDTAKTTVNIVDGEYSTNIAKKRGQVGVFEGQNEEEEEEEELVRG